MPTQNSELMSKTATKSVKSLGTNSSKKARKVGSWRRQRPQCRSWGTRHRASEQNRQFFVKSHDGHKLRRIELYMVFYTPNKF